MKDRFSAALAEAAQHHFYGFKSASLTTRVPSQEPYFEAEWQASSFLDDPVNLQQAVFARDRLLENLISSGIPARYRPQVWGVLTGAHAKRAAALPGYWSELSVRTHGQSEIPHQIEIDLSRTFPHHALFIGDSPKGGLGPLPPGIAALRHLLVAYSLRDPRLGYCQSMNYIAGMLLVLLDGDVEAAFWNLCGIVEDILPEYYTGSMRASMIDQKVFDELLQQELPELIRWWDLHGIDWNFLKFATVFPWFLCIFSHGGNIVPVDLLIWIWDNIFYHGSDFMFEVALTVFKIALPDLLQATTPESSRDVIIRQAQALTDRRSFAASVAATRGSLRSKKLDVAALRLSTSWDHDARAGVRLRAYQLNPNEITELFYKYSSKPGHDQTAYIDADSFTQILSCLWASSLAGITAINDFSEIFRKIDVDRDQKISLLEFVVGTLCFVFSHASADAGQNFVYQLLSTIEPLTLPTIERFISVALAILFENSQYLPSQSLGSHRSSLGPPSTNSLPFTEFSMHLATYPKLLSFLITLDDFSYKNEK